MLARLVLIASVAACAAVTRVRALPPGAPPEGAALVAGRLVQEETRVGSSLRLRRVGGGPEVLVEIDSPDFLAAVPPGGYEITHVGSFAVKGARPRVEAAVGRLAFAGSLTAGRLVQGELPVTMSDGRAEVLAALRRVHGALPDPATEPVEARTLTVVPTSTYYDERHYRDGFHYADRR
jgi:hypothetical protein